MNQSSKTSLDILQGSKQFRQLFHKAGALLRMGKILKECIPRPLNEHVVVANAENNKLILEVESSAWATQLRFYLPALLNTIQRIPELGFIQDVGFYIRPMAQTTPIPLPPKPEMSSQTAKLLREIADSIEDPGLKKAMEKLAENGEKE